MSQRTITVDDRTGEHSDSVNPDGWLRVRVDAINAGSATLELDFKGWQQFREWVELSDPGCAQVLTPPPAVVKA